MTKKTQIKQFVRDWTLVIAIAAGVAGYFGYAAIPWLKPTHHAALQAVEWAQPALIFMMLFLTFCRISLHEIKPCRWQGWLLLLQCCLFVVPGCVLIALPQSGLRVVLEGAMICFICPTATAAAVITRKLGGDIAHIVTYTILINLAASILVPTMVPFVHPTPGMTFVNSFTMILGKVFPLLLMPLILALLVKKLLPSLHRLIVKYPDLSFYMWAVALTFAIGVTTRSVVHSQVDVATQLWLVGISLIACVMQFAIGRAIGRRYGDMVTAGQAMGQKNTVLAIWMGYTFFSPITALAGGFYSIWHNLFNSWQLYRHFHGHDGAADGSHSS